MIPSIDVLAPRYDELWNELVPAGDHSIALKLICQRIIHNRAVYEEASQAVWGTPQYWWWIGITDHMEGGGGANTYLGSGQPLDRITTEVPIGRGPFASFVEGAVDALRGITAPISVSRAAYNWEAYNGWGYLNKPINDPYLASWSNKYEKGKYVADHEYDPEAVSQQPGTLSILKTLVVMEPSIMGPHDPIPPQKPKTVPIEPPIVTQTGGHVMVDITQIERDVNIGLDVAEKILPWLSLILGPQVTALIAAAIRGARTIEAALATQTAGSTTAAAVVAATAHNTPGAPNATQLNGP